MVNTAGRGAPVARLTFPLPAAAAKSVDALAAELMGHLGDSALAMAPRRPGRA